MEQEKGSISAALLCSGAIISKSFLIMPQYMIKNNASAAWIEIATKSLIIYIALTILIKLYKPFAEFSIDKVSEIAFGKFGAAVLNIIYSVSFIIYNAGLLRLLTEGLRTVGMNSVYNEYFAIFILSGVLCGAYKGISTATNLNIVIFPFVVISLAAMVIMLIPYYRASNIMPVLGLGVKPLAKSVFFSHSLFFELIILFFITSRIGGYTGLKKAGRNTMILASSFSTLFTLFYCLVIPYPASESFMLPLYQLARMIKTGMFLQRLEPLMIFIWTVLIMCSMCTAISVVTQLLNGGREEGRRPFVPILIMIIFFLSLIPETELQSFDWYEKALRFGVVLFPIIPFVVVLTARLRKGGENT